MHVYIYNFPPLNPPLILAGVGGNFIPPAMGVGDIFTPAAVTNTGGERVTFGVGGERTNPAVGGTGTPALGVVGGDLKVEYDSPPLGVVGGVCRAICTSWLEGVKGVLDPFFLAINTAPTIAPTIKRAAAIPTTGSASFH
jgi:hypothetical protein